MRGLSKPAKALARKLYVEDGLGPSAVAAAIAAQLGEAVPVNLFKGFATRSGWAGLRDPEKVAAMKRAASRVAQLARGAVGLSPAARTLARKLYVEDGLTTAQINAVLAERLGEVVPEHAVRGLARREGWTAQRDAAGGRRSRRPGPAKPARARVKTTRPPKGAKVARAKPMRAKPPKASVAAAPSRPPEDLAAMVAAAVAAGRVTVLPAGWAAGLSRIEAQAWTCPPPRREDDVAIAARSRRAGHQAALTVAGRGGRRG